MDKIRDWLYIGNSRDTQDLAALEGSGIGAVLQLAGASPQKGIVTYLLPVEDGEPLGASVLREGLAFVANQRHQNKRVLIACAAGVSRSATFTVAALKEAEHASLLDALSAVVSAHPETLPNPILWRSLCDFYAEPFALNEMVRVCRPRNINGAV